MTATLAVRPPFGLPPAEFTALLGELKSNIDTGGGHWVWTGPRTPQHRPTWGHLIPPAAAAYAAVHGTEPPTGRPRKLCQRTRCIYPGDWDWHHEKKPTTTATTTAALAGLLGPTGDGQWQERALCAQADPEAFFPEKGGPTHTAKRVCAACEVRPECLDHALANNERFGIWGGMSERERRKHRWDAVA